MQSSIITSPANAIDPTWASTIAERQSEGIVDHHTIDVDPSVPANLTFDEGAEGERAAYELGEYDPETEGNIDVDPSVPADLPATWAFIVAHREWHRAS